MDIKNITDTVTKRFLEINFLLFISFLSSEFLPKYFFAFINLIFELMPKFIKNYFLNINISHSNYLNAFYFLLILFGLSLLGFSLSFFYPETALSPTLQKFIFTLLISHTSLLIMNIINNYYGYTNNWIEKSKWITGILAFIITVLKRVNNKEEKKQSE